MEERPIILGRDVVRARERVDRLRLFRVVKPQPKSATIPLLDECPYGIVGDRLWVKEEFCGDLDKPISYPKCYRADFPDDYNEAMTFDHSFGLKQWRPALFMPYEYSRMELMITHVECGWLHDVFFERFLIDYLRQVLPMTMTQRIESANKYKKQFIEMWNNESNRECFLWHRAPCVWMVETIVSKIVQKIDRIPIRSSCKTST